MPGRTDTLQGFPGVSRGPDGAYGWEGAQGIMDLYVEPGGVLAGHAKLDPVLALHAHFEKHCPGWGILDAGRGLVHDPDSLRREHARLGALAETLRRRLRGETPH